MPLKSEAVRKTASWSNKSAASAATNKQLATDNLEGEASKDPTVPITLFLLTVAGIAFLYILVHLQEIVLFFNNP